ncbi:MAG: hypothetical protein BroJett014_20240 [Planctomycetota bacterium]|nr:MAG: hypothetical protein BroJett014_20240 [Planctomycetota bacterium]
MRVHHHDMRDMGLAFSLGFDLRRVMIMAVAASWSVAVVGLYFALISWRVGGHSLEGALEPERIVRAWAVLTDSRPTPDRVALWLSMIALWWIGFGKLVTPVQRSIALEVARDERLDSRQMTAASGRLAGLVVGSPVAGYAVAAFLFAVVLGWALLAKIPGLTGAIVSAVFLPIAFIAALVAGLVLIVVTLGLPLMPPAAVMECRDFMDVVSRATAYVLQRPLRYLLGLLLKLLVVIGAALVAAATLAAAWALILGALWLVGEGELAHSTWSLVARSGDPLGPFTPAASLFAAVFYASALVALGWLMTVSAATDTLLYCIMRYEVDGITFDEIMIPQEFAQRHLTAADTHEQAKAVEAAALEQGAKPDKTAASP